MTDAYIHYVDEQGQKKFVINEELLGGMREYDSLEDAQRDLAIVEAKVAPLVQPYQREITWGDEAIRFIPHEGSWLPIFLDIPSLSELQTVEDEETVERLQEQHRRGYLWARCYSVLEPLGEWGSTHCVMVSGKLARLEFMQAMQFGWNFDQLYRQKFPWVHKMVKDEEYQRRIVDQIVAVFNTIVGDS